MCGGYASGDVRDHDECFEYGFALNAWIPGDVLPQGNVSDCAYAWDEHWGLVITGGRNETDKLDHAVASR